MRISNQKIYRFNLIIVVLIFLISCKIKTNLVNADTDKSKIKNELFAFDFTLDKKSIPERVHFLDSLGYMGVTFPVNTLADIAKIDAYQKAIVETKSRFSIPAVFYAHNPKAKNASETWMAIANKLVGTKTDIWVIVSKPKNQIVEQKEVLAFFNQISDYADSLHLNVVIYPHDETFIESASEALWYVKQSKRKNLFLAFHLCHELRAGNGNRMNAAIAEVAPYIKLASICGADSVMLPNQLPGFWDDAIKPLYKGNYDSSLMLECLVRNGYDGPIALHTFGLKEPVDEHFNRSLLEWNRLKIKVSKEL
jgi:sugar phosphate isomerase/epimerase